MATKKKPKKEKAAAEPFWNELVEVWFNFCQEQKKEKPTFDGSAPRDLKLIVASLRKRAIESGQEWTQELATTRLYKFLLFAYEGSGWLRENWLLLNINRQKDVVFFNLAKYSTK
jgi:hypothetical protein